MELTHIDTAKLCVSAANMRARGKADLSHILPSIRARCVLVPLIVRAKPSAEPVDGGSPDTYEIVAGKRRYHAALAVAQEAADVEQPVDRNVERQLAAMLDAANNHACAKLGLEAIARAIVRLAPGGRVDLQKIAAQDCVS